MMNVGYPSFRLGGEVGCFPGHSVRTAQFLFGTHDPPISNTNGDGGGGAAALLLSEGGGNLLLGGGACLVTRWKWTRRTFLMTTSLPHSDSGGRRFPFLEN